MTSSLSLRQLENMWHWQKQPPEVFKKKKKVFLKMLRNLQKNNWASVSFLIKLQAVGVSFLIKLIRIWHGCFPVNFAKFLRTPFLQNTSGRLLLHWDRDIKIKSINVEYYFKVIDRKGLGFEFARDPFQFILFWVK